MRSARLPIDNIAATATTPARNMIELAGRRLGDNVQMGTGTGVRGLGVSKMTTSRNVVRNNPGDGMVLTATVLGLNLSHDYVCGGEFEAGVTIDGTGFSTVNGTGLTTAYNSGHGILLSNSILFGTLNLNNDNAFTANTSCGLRNESPLTVSAQNNQWRPPTGTTCAPSPDYCPPGPGEGAIVCSVLQSHRNSAIGIDDLNPTLQTQPTYPSNAIVKGQGVRVAGKGFNAIDGNPVPPAACTIAELSGENCCRKKTKANVCGTGAPVLPPQPPADFSNCVALKDGAGRWVPLPVTSVTPTTIVAELPDSLFVCVGGSEKVRVAKYSSLGDVKEDMQDYCISKALF